MCFFDVDHSEIGVFVLLAEPTVQLPDLRSERRSSAAAKNQHERFRQRSFPKIKNGAILDGSCGKNRSSVPHFWGVISALGKRCNSKASENGCEHSKNNGAPNRLFTSGLGQRGNIAFTSAKLSAPSSFAKSPLSKSSWLNDWSICMSFNCKNGPTLIRETPASFSS